MIFLAPAAPFGTIAGGVSVAFLPLVSSGFNLAVVLKEVDNYLG